MARVLEGSAERRVQAATRSSKQTSLENVKRRTKGSRETAIQEELRRWQRGEAKEDGELPGPAGHERNPRSDKPRTHRPGTAPGGKHAFPNATRAPRHATCDMQLQLWKNGAQRRRIPAPASASGSSIAIVRRVLRALAQAFPRRPSPPRASSVGKCAPGPLVGEWGRHLHGGMGESKGGLGACRPID